VTKCRKRRDDKARDEGPRRRTPEYAEEPKEGGTRLRVAQSALMIGALQ